jgi:hypothetical protein
MAEKKNEIYNTDASMRNTPLRLDEVEALTLSGGKVFKDTNVSLHFLSRVSATLKEHRRKLVDFQLDIDRMKIKRSEENHPLTKAINALEALTPEQRKQLLDSGYITAVEQLKEKEELAERARLASLSETNRMRMSFSKLLSDPEVPQDVRVKIKAVIDKFNK